MHRFLSACRALVIGAVILALQGCADDGGANSAVAAAGTGVAGFGGTSVSSTGSGSAGTEGGRGGGLTATGIGGDGTAGAIGNGGAPSIDGGERDSTVTFPDADVIGDTGMAPMSTRKWHPTALTFEGPATSEDANPNPFRDYRMTVTFTKGSRKITAQGYFAADGNAADSGAKSGNQWRAHFVPDEEGTWSYAVSFRTATDIAISLDAAVGSPVPPDGRSGSIEVLATDETGRDFRGKGPLRYDGNHYLSFGNGDHFLKGGADSPETFLAYADFDGTKPTHHYAPHVADWRTGDPTWANGKGKGIIGALDYLASKGMNSVYFLTMNVGGDGKDVWPWTSDVERYRFDCSKLDQWEVVFTHMDHMGLMLHVVTQETENDQLLDGGALGPQRKLYYRELVARFSHHLAITWNLGEENTNTTAELKSFASHLHGIDPYGHPVVVHTFPGQYETVYRPLVGFASLDGPSLQMVGGTHAETLKWLGASAQAGHKWVVSLDEIGPAGDGVVPDATDPRHDTVRKNDLWGNLMAGGAGCEWYFGYSYPNSDLNCEDFRSRDKMWDETRLALEFFHRHLPFWDMTAADGLTSASDDYCLAKPGEIYAVYLPTGAATTLDIAGPAGTYTVGWYDPRAGGDLQVGTVPSVMGPGKVSLGAPPTGAGQDWAVLVKR